VNHIWNYSRDARVATCRTCGIKVRTVRGKRGGAESKWTFPDGRTVLGGSTPPCARSKA
jgi:hypothetical protein